MRDVRLFAAAMIVCAFGAATACVVPEDAADELSADEDGELDEELGSISQAVTSDQGQLTSTLIASSCSGATTCGVSKTKYFTGSGTDSVWLTGTNPHAYGTTTGYVTVCARYNKPNVKLVAWVRVSSGSLVKSTTAYANSGSTGKVCAFAQASISKATDYVPNLESSGSAYH